MITGIGTPNSQSKIPRPIFHLLDLVTMTQLQANAMLGVEFHRRRWSSRG